MHIAVKPREQPVELSVSEVTRRVKARIEGAADLRDLWIRGELSNIRLHGGNLYFTLKDDSSQLTAVYWNYGRGGRKPPEDGKSALVHGEVAVYAQRGQYQLVADDLVKVGEGDHAQRFEELKRKLHAEGLFEPERKLTLPRVPQGIGVVTGASTAALQDVLNVLRRRAPYARVVLFACTVQGPAAPPEIACAVQAADACPGIDVILLVRGGGSAEDLACFNDEALARALAEVRRPLVTGIGHEIDFTIADFVADERAPTPSAAAELVAPDVADLTAAVAQHGARLARTARRIELQRGELERLFDRRLLRDVARLVDDRRQGLDEASITLVRNIVARTHGSGPAGEARARWYGQLAARMAAPLVRQLGDHRHAADRLESDLLRSTRRRLDTMAERVQAAALKAAALDPRAPLRNGFALVWDADGKLIRDPAAVATGQDLRVEVEQGEMQVRRV